MAFLWNFFGISYKIICQRKPIPVFAHGQIMAETITLMNNMLGYIGHFVCSLDDAWP